MFSQESLQVKCGPVQGAQLLMFGEDAGSSPVFHRASSQRSAYKQWLTRTGGNNTEQFEGGSQRRVARDGNRPLRAARGSDPKGEYRLNKVMLTGRLGRNARMRETKSGQMVADFFVGTEEFHKDLLGQWQQRPAWHRVQVWGEAAKMVSTQLREDSQLYVEGKLVIRKWTDKKNKRQTSIEILASDVRCLDEGPKTVANGQ